MKTTNWSVYHAAPLLSWIAPPTMAVRWRSAYERVSIALHPLQVLWLRSQRVFLYFRTLFPQLVVPLSFSSGTPLLPFFFFAFALLALAISLNRVGQPLLCHSFVSTLKRRAAHSLHLSGGVSGAWRHLTSMVYHSIVRGMQEQHTKHVTYKIAYHFVWCPKYRKAILQGESYVCQERGTPFVC